MNQLGVKSLGYLGSVPYSHFMIARRFNHRLAMRKWYQTLGVTENCEDETLRLAFVHLAKRFHPDSGTREADATRFSEIENAYRQIRKARNEERETSSISAQVEEFDIEHTAPQHRHYLTYDTGIGTPGKRQRLHTLDRANKAADNVMEHRLKKLQAEERNTLVGMDKQRAKDVKTRFGMDRLVEDLIQEAMNKGEFSDLPGTGKPLKENVNSRNPYVDYVTHKLNEILIENGFSPEWIQLSKEIREDTRELRKELAKARNKVGPVPLSPADEASWRNIVEDFQSSTKRLNNKIDKYNLLVPILEKQMFQIKLEDIANEALSVPGTKVIENGKRSIDSTKDEHENIFAAISSIFKQRIE